MQFKRFSRIIFFSAKKKRVGNIDDTHVLTVLSILATAVTCGISKWHAWL